MHELSVMGPNFTVLGINLIVRTSLFTSEVLPAVPWGPWMDFCMPYGRSMTFSEETTQLNLAHAQILVATRPQALADTRTPYTRRTRPYGYGRLPSPHEGFTGRERTRPVRPV